MAEASNSGGDQVNLSAGQIRQKRILSEIAMLKHLNKEHFQIEQSNDQIRGFSIHVEIKKCAIPSQMVKNDIESYDFEILMSNKYPFRDPQVLCHTQFTHPMVCIIDNRDLFREVVGEGGWKVGHKLYSLIQLIPEFIQEMYLMEEDLYTVGTFHLGQVYDMRLFFPTPEEEQTQKVVGVKNMNVFGCQEQVDECCEEFQVRSMVVTPSAILLLQPIQQDVQYGILLAWASLQSIARLRKNAASPKFLSIIFKPVAERQPWVLNLMVPNHEECVQLIVSNLTQLGVNNKAAKVKSQHVDRPKIALSEVTKEAIMEMNVDELNINMQAYEQEVMLASESDSSAGLTISTVQTLITLYQKAIEYYSAMDDSSYLDVRNRMQSLLMRPDVEALMASAQDDQAKTQQQSSASQEEGKSGSSPAKEPTVAAQDVSFKIDDDEDDEEDGKLADDTAPQ